MKYVLTLSILLLGIAHSLFGQGLDTSPGGQNGTFPFGSYSSSGIDTINLYNGNLALDIPVLSMPGRDLSSGIHMAYNSQKWQQFNFLGTVTGVYTGGWRLNNPVGDRPQFETLFSGCNANVARWFITAWWVDGQGAKRMYGGRIYDLPAPGCATLPNPAAGLWLASASGDGSMIETGDTNPAYGRIWFEDGTIIDLVGTTPKIVTRNGNFLEIDAYGLPLKDTLGRTIGYGNNKGPTPAPYQKVYPTTDSNGALVSPEVTYDWSSQAWDPFELHQEGIEDHLTRIKLANGSSYYFEYNDNCAVAGYGTQNMGYLTKVILPTGGYIRYTYQCDGSLLNDLVTGRHVSVDGGSIEDHWTYVTLDSSCALPYTGTCRQVTETKPDGAVVLHQFTPEGLEYETTFMDASVVLVKTVSSTWINDGIVNCVCSAQGQAINPRMASQITGVDQIKRRTILSYDDRGWLSGRTDSDWYTGTTVVPLSAVIYTYVADMVPPTLDILGIRKNLWFVETQGWNGTTHVRQGLTEYVYDGSSLTSTPPTVSQKGLPEGTSYAHRMNVTSVKRYAADDAALVEHFGYDDLGNVVSVTSPNGKTTAISYADSFASIPSQPTYALPTSVSIPVSDTSANLTSSSVYDYNTGLLMSAVDARLVQTTYTYDSLDRLTRTIANSGGLSVSTAYVDTPGFVQTTVSAAMTGGVSNTQDTYFDGLGRAIRAVDRDPAGDVTTWVQYDTNGRLRKTSAPYRGSGTPVWTEATYDAADRIVMTTNPDSTFATFIYANDTVTVTDEAGNQRRVKTNAMGKIVEVSEPNPTLASPLITTYRYSVLGNLLHVNQSGLERSFEFDWLGRLKKETHPESGETSYVYGADGQLESRSDARFLIGSTTIHIKTSYTYDFIGRLLTTSYNDGTTPTVTRTYDQNTFKGLLTTMVDAAGTVNYGYASNSNLLTAETRVFTDVTMPSSLTTSYSYDNGGRLTGVTYPSGRIVNRTYSSAGALTVDRVSSLVDTYASTSRTLLGSIQDNSAGQITSQALGGSTTETRVFNSRLQLTGISAVQSSNSLLNLSYGYGTSGNNGKIRSRTDGLQGEHSVNYSYDALQRLSATTAADDSWNVGWTFDDFGNRKSQGVNAVAAAHGAATQTMGYSNNRISGFGYDNAGNITSMNSNTFAYDGEGRMVQAGSTYVYVYDGDGRRVKKISSGETRYYVYGLTGLLSEFSTNATGADSNRSTDRLRYRIADQTGTEVVGLNSSGIMVENNRLLPNGEQWDAASSSANSDEKFTSYQRDLETGLDYAMARYYTNLYGRFMSPDPGHVGSNVGDPQSWNAYTYGLNDPINGIDPDGTYIQRVSGRDVCELGRGTLTAVYIGTFRFRNSPQKGTDTFDTAITGYDCDFPDDVPAAPAEAQGGGDGGSIADGVKAARDFLNNKQYTNNCKQVLDRLSGVKMANGKLSGKITVSVLLRGINAAEFNDGSQTPFWTVYAVGTANRAQTRNSTLTKNWTVADAMIVYKALAMAQIGGNGISVTKQLMMETVEKIAGVIFHEGTHILGFEEPQLTLYGAGYEVLRVNCITQ